jgi:hypothetical protein
VLVLEAAAAAAATTAGRTHWLVLEAARWSRHRGRRGRRRRAPHLPCSRSFSYRVGVGQLALAAAAAEARPHPRARRSRPREVAAPPTASPWILDRMGPGLRRLRRGGGALG